MKVLKYASVASAMLASMTSIHVTSYTSTLLHMFASMLVG